MKEEGERVLPDSGKEQHGTLNIHLITIQLSSLLLPVNFVYITRL